MFECGKVGSVPFLWLVETHVLLSSVLRSPPSYKPSAASTQKRKLFLVRSIEVRQALIWILVLVIFTIGFPCVEHFIFTTTFRCGSCLVSSVLLVRIWDLRELGFVT